MNINNKKLKICSKKPMTGYYRNGFCKTGVDDMGTHTICAIMTDKFLEYSKKKGNNLKTKSGIFHGLKKEINGVYVNIDGMNHIIKE